MNSNNIFENQGIISAVAASIDVSVSSGADYLITVTKKRKSAVL